MRYLETVPKSKIKNDNKTKNFNIIDYQNSLGWIIRLVQA